MRTSLTASLSFCLAIFSNFGRRFSTDSKSANTSSILITSISSIGLTRPETCVTLSSSNARTTWQIASTSRICDKNLFPNPSPFEAPLTIPAISVNSKVVGIVFLGCTISVNTSNL